MSDSNSLYFKQVFKSKLPKTTYSKDGIFLALDDNFDWIQDDSIDLILTDPPFNIARDTNFHTYEKNTINSYRFDKNKGWDSYSQDQFRNLIDQWVVSFERVLKPGGTFAIFCADDYISDFINSLNKAKLNPRRTLTWRKPNAVPVNRKHMMMSACEYVVVGVKKSKATFNSTLDPKTHPKVTSTEVVAIADKVAVVLEQQIRKALGNLDSRPPKEELYKLIEQTVSKNLNEAVMRSINIYSDDKKLIELCIPNYVSFNSKAGNRLHPTEKPVNLITYLIEILSNEADLILDPFAGSGSTGEASFYSNRNVILVETDLEFYEKARNRISSLKSSNQISLLEGDLG